MSGEGSVELGIGGLTDAALVAAGGFGRVFRARQEALGRWVAVKVLHGVDDASRRRFDRERRAMGRLSEHPGIVTIYESGLTDRNEPYLVMALLEAGSYQDRLDQDGPLDWNDAATTVATAARTIADAHHAGIIHRDLKPANILVSATNTPLITDFGIARLADTDTTIGPVSLTPAYSPPEVLAGEEPSPASDVYALGATLYTLIAGRPAFTTGPDENWLDVIERARTEPIPDLPAGPAGLSDTIRLAMAKDPSQRPNPTHLADLLDRLAANPDTPVVSATITTPTPKRPRRRIALAATTAILLLTAATTAIYLTQQQDPDTTTTQPTTNPTPQPTTNPTPQPTTTPTTTPTPAAATAEEDTIATPAGELPRAIRLSHPFELREKWATSQLSVAEGAIWVRGRGAVSRINVETGRVTDTLELNGAVIDIIGASGEIWVAAPLRQEDEACAAGPPIDEALLYRIDAATRQITDELCLNNVRSMFLGADGRLWAAGRSREGSGLPACLPPAQVVDRASGSVASVPSLEGMDMRNTRSAEADGLLHITGARCAGLEFELSIVDTRTGELIAQVPPPFLIYDDMPLGGGVGLGGPLTSQISDDAIWLIPSDGVVIRVARSTLEITDVISLDGEAVVYDPDCNCADMDRDRDLAIAEGAVGHGALWVTVLGQGVLTHIDLVSRRVTGSVEIGTSLERPVIGPDAVWISDLAEGVVLRVDPTTREVTDRVAVGDEPGPAVIVADHLWVPNTGDSTISVIPLADFG